MGWKSWLRVGGHGGANPSAAQQTITLSAFQSTVFGHDRVPSVLFSIVIEDSAIAPKAVSSEEFGNEFNGIPVTPIPLNTLPHVVLPVTPTRRAKATPPFLVRFLTTKGVMSFAKSGACPNPPHVAHVRP
jgi:hypothetical protein